MPELSPRAEAILNAVTFTRYDAPYFACPKSIDQIRLEAAGVLRAAADIIKRSATNSTPSTDWGDGWKDGMRDTARGLLAIAAELEAH